MEQCKALHLDGQAALFVAQFFPVGRLLVAGLAVEHVGGMDVALDQRNTGSLGAGAQGIVQRGARRLDVVGVAALGHGVVALGVGTRGQHHVKQFCLVGVGAGGADADDVLDAVLGVQLVGIDADGRHAHAAAHHADGAALIGAGVAVHTADVGDKARVLEEGLGNEFGAQRVAGHQDGLGEIAVFSAVMGGRHKSTLLYFAILVDTVYHTFAVCGKLKARNFVKEAFYHANTIQAQQECFLRGLVVQMEPLGERETYSPLRWVLKIMFDLFERTGDYKINYIEFAVCVQTSSPKYELETVVNKILEIRGRRKKCINKKKFDRDLIHNAWKHYFKEEKNFHEYADMNLRYLSASGILKRSGRGITVMPEYKSLAYELTKNVISDATLKERYKLLCQGAPLPTDNTEIAKKVLEDLINELEMYNIKYEIPDITLDNSKNINIVRSNLKQNIDHYKEEKYAQNQRECWYEIYEYMKLLISNNGKSKELGEDYIINVPKAEAAAYLEWILWRAFLAIDHIVNKPYDARGFNVDQDYLPIGTAPGGKPDMIFEFDDYVIVVEVTLSTNSRQEAMEGEPVRRHVADLVQKYKKPVYGLFVANKIDSNTAETFRMGVWYTTQDERLELHIVPLTLTQFSEYFKFIFTENFAEPQKIVDLMCNCENYRKICEGPEWKKCINEVVQIMTKG